VVDYADSSVSNHTLKLSHHIVTNNEVTKLNVVDTDKTL